jgi:hypothetical protein
MPRNRHAQTLVTGGISLCALRGGRAVTSYDERNETDHCPDCGQPLEIAAVKFSLFWQAALLFVCPGCGLARADEPKAAAIDGDQRFPLP